MATLSDESSSTNGPFAGDADVQATYDLCDEISEYLKTLDLDAQSDFTGQNSSASVPGDRDLGSDDGGEDATELEGNDSDEEFVDLEEDQLDDEEREELARDRRERQARKAATEADKGLASLNVYRLPLATSIRGAPPSAATLQAFQDHLTSRHVQYDETRTVLAFKSLSKAPDTLAKLRTTLSDPFRDPVPILREVLRDSVESHGNYVRCAKIRSRMALVYLDKLLSLPAYSQHRTLQRYREAARQKPNAHIYMLYAGESVNRLRTRHKFDSAAASRWVFAENAWWTWGEARSAIGTLYAFLTSQHLDLLPDKAAVRARVRAYFTMICGPAKFGDFWTMDVQEQVLIWCTNGLNIQAGGKRAYPVPRAEDKARLLGGRDVRDKILFAGVADSKTSEQLFSMTFDYSARALGLPFFPLDSSKDLFLFYPGEVSGAAHFKMRARDSELVRNDGQPIKPVPSAQRALFLSRVKERPICIILGSASLAGLLQFLKPLATSLTLKGWKRNSAELVRLKDGTSFVLLFTYDPGVVGHTRNSAYLRAIAGQIGQAWEIGQCLASA